MVARVSYERALKAFGPWKSDSRVTTTGDVKRALRALSIDVGSRTIPIRWEKLWKLKHDAILLVNVSRVGIGHWVAWDARKRRPLDPANSSHLTVRAYLPVYGTARRRRKKPRADG